MAEETRPIVCVAGVWMPIEVPLAPEFEMLRSAPGLLSRGRRAEIRAWTEQVRMALTHNDRRFLRSLRIAPWEIRR